MIRLHRIRRVGEIMLAILLQMIVGMGVATATETMDTIEMRDTTYYIYPNIQNPWLQKNPLYYNDAMNVLYDLHTFERLHVQYHSCVMIPSTSSSNQDDDVDENDDWYIGATPIIEAQISFSLYGVKKEDTGSDSSKQNWFQQQIHRSSCHRSTFINSFYTTSSMMSFINSLITTGKLSSSFDASTIPSTSLCHVQDNYGYGTVCSKDDPTEFSFNQYSLVTSSSNGRTGSVCTPKYLLSTTSTLEPINQLLHQKELHCFEIYNDDDGADGASGSDSAVQTLLTNSHSCNVLYDPYNTDGKQCPDPYHILQHREHSLASTMIQEVTMMMPSIRQQQRKQKIIYASIVLFVVSCIMLIVASMIFLFQYQKTYGLRRRKRRQRRSRSYRQKQQQKVRQANDQWKRQQQPEVTSVDDVTCHMKLELNHLDDTTSTVASSSTNGDDDNSVIVKSSFPSDMSQSIFVVWSNWTSRPRFHNPFSTRVENDVATPLSNDTGTSRITTNEPYQQFPEHSHDDIFDLPIVDDGPIESDHTISSITNNNNVNNSGHNDRFIRNDKHTTTTSPTSIIVETFKKPRRKSSKTRILLEEDNVGAIPRTNANNVNENNTMEEHTFPDKEVPKLVSTNPASAVPPQPPQSLSSSASMFQQFAARRQRLLKLRKEKPAKLNEHKYIPPSLESLIISVEPGCADARHYVPDPTTASQVHNKVSSFKVKDLVSEVDRLQSVLTNDAIDRTPQRENDSSETFGMNADITVEPRNIVPSKSAVNVDDYTLKVSVPKSRNESLMNVTEAQNGNLFSSVTACICTDVPCTPFHMSHSENMNDSLLSDENVSDVLHTNEKSVASPCRTVTPEQLTKQLTATRYVRAIGETLVSSVDSDTMRTNTKTSIISMGDGHSPVNVQSYLSQRQKSPIRMSLPVPRVATHQSHRSKDIKPVGLRSYASIRQSNSFVTFDTDVAEDVLVGPDIVSNEDGAGWETFDSMLFETPVHPKFIRVVHDDTTHDTTPASNDSMLVMTTGGRDGDVDTTVSSSCSTFDNDGDDSVSLKYVTEIPFQPSTERVHGQCKE